ncbi:MAG: hypothetical protein NC314_11640 [Roseburia sp.]|nr:hypothetical protein [Ruminococcus sp.]MCM1156280.1 hypothetical protein [Roseburia sp.]MCM1243485.1 hypothetical protein [Roseburia sp.]
MDHGKKMIAPIVIAVFFVLYYIGIAVIFMMMPVPVIVRVLFIVVPLLLAAVMLGALISRIKEIKGGEEDDLSQY